MASQLDFKNIIVRRFINKNSNNRLLDHLIYKNIPVSEILACAIFFGDEYFGNNLVHLAHGGIEGIYEINDKKNYQNDDDDSDNENNNNTQYMWCSKCNQIVGSDIIHTTERIKSIIKNSIMIKKYTEPYDADPKQINTLLDYIYVYRNAYNFSISMELNTIEEILDLVLFFSGDIAYNDCVKYINNKNTNL